MNTPRTISLAVAAAVAAGACGDNSPSQPPLRYTDPPPGGKLRLVRDAASDGSAIVLDLVVGDEPVNGYSVGFDLPLAPGRVTLAGFTPGVALSPGEAPAAALARLPTRGPLADTLVTGQSHKATGAGAIAIDTTLPRGAVLYTIELESVPRAPAGVVFDGAADGFVLPSGGMRARTGETVVAADEVAIGRLEIARP